MAAPTYNRLALTATAASDVSVMTGTAVGVTAGNGMLIAIIHRAGVNITGVTIGGAAMAACGTALNYSNDTMNFYWVAEAPSTGNLALSVSFSGNLGTGGADGYLMEFTGPIEAGALNTVGTPPASYTTTVADAAIFAIFESTGTSGQAPVDWVTVKDQGDVWVYHDVAYSPPYPTPGAQVIGGTYSWLTAVEVYAGVSSGGGGGGGGAGVDALVEDSIADLVVDLVADIVA